MKDQQFLGHKLQVFGRYALKIQLFRITEGKDSTPPATKALQLKLIVK